MLGLNFSKRPPAASEPPDTAYRLTSWPDLPDDTRTAAVYRALSRMSMGPVSRRWFIGCTRLRPEAADALLALLLRYGAIQQIDIARFGSAH